jgi:hypothetical protein
MYLKYAHTLYQLMKKIDLSVSCMTDFNQSFQDGVDVEAAQFCTILE